MLAGSSDCHGILDFSVARSTKTFICPAQFHLEVISKDLYIWWCGITLPYFERKYESWSVSTKGDRDDDELVRSIFTYCDSAIAMMSSYLLFFAVFGEKWVPLSVAVSRSDSSNKKAGKGWHHRKAHNPMHQQCVPKSNLCCSLLALFTQLWILIRDKWTFFRSHLSQIILSDCEMRSFLISSRRVFIMSVSMLHQHALHCAGALWCW